MEALAAGAHARPAAPRRLAVLGDEISPVLAAAARLAAQQPGATIDAFAGAGAVRHTSRPVLPIRSYGRTAEPALYDEIVDLRT